MASTYDGSESDDDDGRGWVRTNGLSRVKGDEERADSGVNAVDKTTAHAITFKVVRK